MDDLWWRLPGPSEFVTSAADHIRTGRNVFIDVPRDFPHGFKTALRSQLAESDGWSWNTIRTDDDPGDVNPIELMCDSFGDGPAPGRPRGLNDLLALENFAGRLIWVEGFSSPTWPAWLRFITEYAHACHQESSASRTLFCHQFSGPRDLPRPRVDSCLGILTWDDRVGISDLQLYAAHRLRRAPIPGLERELAAATVANLAIWDVLLAEDLIEAFDRGLCDPIPVLEEHARRRGWQSGQDIHEDPWFEGKSHTQGGQLVRHSAACDLDDVLKRRLWKAQVTVLFPILEEVRQMLLQKLSAFLMVPFTTRDSGVILDPQDLELSHIEAQCAERPLEVDREIFGLVQVARRARNALAHLETVPVSLIGLLAQHVG